ncbi:MAG TPA: glycosyltransferase family 4 protein [Nitrospirales bacterium]|nr:glycosyltransferase family 4 protein [Nitrospirales bacterium]
MPVVRVAHIITKLELGGAQQNTLFTVAHLDRARFQPILITGERGLLDDEADRLTGVDLHRVASLRRPIHPWMDARALVELTRLLKRLQPTIVHTHSSKAGILGRLAAHRAGVPVIIHTIHGLGITPDQPVWLRGMLIRAERLAGRHTTRCFAVSEANREAAIRLRLIPADRCVVLRSGIDIAAYRNRRIDVQAKRRELGLSVDHAVIGMVAPMKAQKAPLDFVRVARAVQEARPDAQFVYVGDGPLRRAVEQEIVRLGPAGLVRLVGWRRDVPDLLRCFDALLLTSRWEGLPRVYLEALASGVPVVGTAVDGAGEVIQDAVNGFLCAPGDIEALAQKVLYLIEKPDEARRLGRTGQQGLPADFDIHAMVRAQERHYSDLTQLN